MARGTKKAEVDIGERVEVTAEGGVLPLKAVHKIFYGNGQVAEPNTFFVPLTEDERVECLEKECAVEPEAHEVAVAVAASGSTAAVEPEPVKTDDNDDVIE